MEQSPIWQLMMLLPTVMHQASRAYMKGKAVDPSTLKPAWKTTEFWLAVITTLIGALGTFTGTATP